MKDLHYTTQKLLLQCVPADHKFQQYTKIATSGTEMMLARMKYYLRLGEGPLEKFW